MKYLTHTLAGTVALMLFLAAPSFGQAVSQTQRAIAPQVLRPMPWLPAAAKQTESDVLLRYYDLRTGGTGFDLTGDFRAAGTFFTAPFDGSVDRVSFAVPNDLYPDGTNGTGTLRLKMLSGPILPLDPTEEGLASVDLLFSQIMASGGISPGNLSTQVDLTGEDFDVREGREYFLQLSLVNESAGGAVSIFFDGGTEDTTDTDYYPPRSWVYILAASSPDTLDGYYTFVNNRNWVVELELTEAPPPPPPPVALAQFVHNAPAAGPVDVYVGDSLEADNLAFQQATTFTEVLAGEQQVDIVAGNDPDNANPLFSKMVTLEEAQLYHAIAYGTPGVDVDVALVGARTEGGGSQNTGDKVPLTFFNGSAETLTFNLLTGSQPGPLAGPLAFGSVSPPAPVDADTVDIEVAGAGGQRLNVYKFDLSSDGGIGTFVGPLLVLTQGTPGGTPPFGLFGVQLNGEALVPTDNCTSAALCVSTATGAALELPEAFALHANYPNPFNPVTTIAFDLAAPSQAHLTVYTLLGQRVATLVDGLLPAGTHAVRFDSARLPSGTYLYRLDAGSFSQQRMLTLVK